MKIPENPFKLFNKWYSEAESSGALEPEAASLATTNEDSFPSVRIVLIKSFSKDGFIFYTNLGSDKSEEIKNTPKVALCFYWKEIAKQVRIQGTVEQISNIEADKYFKVRPRGSQIGAWASIQSKTMDSEQDLEKRFEEFSLKFKDYSEISRPEFWSGYRIKPKLMEFWIKGESRLHTRVRYDIVEGKYSHKFIYP